MLAKQKVSAGTNNQEYKSISVSVLLVSLGVGSEVGLHPTGVVDRMSSA
jgi:hypothetical protein